MTATHPLRRVVLASGNAGKRREIERVLAPYGIEVVPQSAFDIPSPEETGLTFVENALIKARHAAERSGLPALADDSGLAVDALDGAPGVISARYAGPEATDADNVDKLLSALAGVPEAQRSARFHCVLVCLRSPDDPAPLIAEGRWEGRIAAAPAGDQGFGYDPVFFDPHCAATAAQLPPEQKDRRSHRGQALRRLAEQWRSLTHP